MPRARRKGGLTSRLVLALVAGLIVGGAGAAAAMSWLLREPVTLSRAEREALARARGEVDTLIVPVTPPARATEAARTRDAAADSALGVAPNVVGLEEGAARTLILTAGFVVGTVTPTPSERPAGEVIATFPEAGERVPLPATINLIVSAGPGSTPPDSATPPDTLPPPRPAA
jgi:hypothetical protein